MKEERKLAIRTFNNKYKVLTAARALFYNKKDWLSSIKLLLGMSSRQLAKRLNLAESAISKAESQEKEGSITLKRLERYADALECDLVYALIPRQKIDKILDNEAQKKAKILLDKSTVMMELENQGVESRSEINRQLDKLTLDIKNSKQLWD